MIPYKPIPKGFTLIELIVVVAIIAATLTFGIPNLRATIISNRLTASANDMIVALQLARSESIKQVKLAGVSIGTNHLGNAEPNKWITFLENSTLPTSTPTPGTGRLIQSYAAADGLSVSSDDVDDTISYRPDGRLEGAATTTITLTAAGVTENRIITIAPSGRVSVVTTP